MATTKEISRNLGGDRLGSGNKNNIDLHAYNRSTHDLSETFRSSMNVGTLVPYYVQLGMNGDSFTMSLDNITRTIPSIGPLYGSYKLQLDMFECPIRLYNGLLHNNMTGIGLNMSAVKFPKIKLKTNVKKRSIYNEDINKSQISKSSLINYLGLNGIADYNFTTHTIGNIQNVERKFNAIPLIAYYDIYKNYYANKQEGKGVIIKANPVSVINKANKITFSDDSGEEFTSKLTVTTGAPTPIADYYIYEDIDLKNGIGVNLGNYTKIKISELTSSLVYDDIAIVYYDRQTEQYVQEYISNISSNIKTEQNGDILITLNSSFARNGKREISGLRIIKQNIVENNGLELKTFELDDIDEMRMKILQNTGLNNELIVNDVDKPLWQEVCGNDNDNATLFKYSQHGLAIKTYQSDLYNNWLKTEWIDGENGINKITAIDTSSGSFEVDAFILAKKIYNMLNRVAVSGGSYEDWQEAVYSVKAIRRAETPIYRGGMSAEIMFSEVVSNSATENEPLGTIAGKGGDFGKHGGTIEISCDEPCIVIGIVSITPRVDYSQGNSWILTELDNMDDIHKPALDGIGFQDLLQEQMAFWGTYKNDDGDFVKLAAGKVPAWMNYMTSVNHTHGDFAEEDKCMFMTLNRRYEYGKNDSTIGERSQMGITDLTTYVDPRKYNYIFADDSLEAQNFWIQIGIKVHARRVMSAKVIPFL